MRFSVLGPFEAWDDDVRRDLGHETTRTLLALLVLHRNEVVSVDRIIDALWGDDPPAAARELLEDDVGRLRELVGDTVVTHAWGYGLRTPVGSVDVDDFERLVSRARSEEPAVAAGSLREALALWRGSVLADFTDTSFARDEIAQLETARRAAEAELRELTTGARRRHRLLPAGSRRWKVVAACVAAIAVTTIAIVWDVAPGESRHVVTGPNMVAALDPRTNRLVDAFTVGKIPGRVAVGGNVVWVYNEDDQTLSLIDPRTRLVRTISAGGSSSLDAPASFGAGPTSAWVGNGWAGTVSRIDSRSAEVVRTIRLPGERYTAASFIVTSPSEVWVSGLTLPKNAPSPLEPLPNPPPPPGKLPPSRLLAWRIDPRTNRVTRTISLDKLGWSARTFVVSGDSVLVRGDDGLARIDRRTGDVKTRLSLPSHGCCEWAGLAVGAGSIWVVGLSRDVLWRIDPRAGAVWVADGNGAILKIDPRKNEIVKRIPIEGVPHSLAFGLGRLWVALD